jgi:surfeit locus 1 family protein
MTEPVGGFLRANDPLQQRWYSRDVTAMSRAAQIAPAAPFFVDAGRPGQTVADAGAVWPRPGLTVVRFANSHLVYALTWYGLALMVVGAGWAVAGYERRRVSASPHPRSPAHDPSTR